MEELGSMIKAGSLKYVLRTGERFMVAAVGCQEGRK